MSEKINQGKVMDMLTNAFSTSEIDTLAFDLFPQIYGDFAGGMSKIERIRTIVQFAVNQGQVEAILKYVQRHNPYQYNRFAPDIFNNDSD